MPKDLSRLDRLAFGEKTLIFFVDETGGETLDDSNQPIFGFGGCGVLGEDLERFVNQPWRGVRRVIYGTPDRALHAAELPVPIRHDHIDAISTFFRNHPFARFGVTCDLRTEIPSGLSVPRVLLASLQNRLNYLLRWTWASDVVVNFEHSERLEEAVRDGFGNFVPHQFGRVLDWLPCFMPKAANEPALEVADFVVHAIGGEARMNFRRNEGLFLREDFKAVFYSVPGSLATYTHARRVHRGNQPRQLP
jgi:hypothetical protein